MTTHLGLLAIRLYAPPLPPSPTDALAHEQGGSEPHGPGGGGCAYRLINHLAQQCTPEAYPPDLVPAHPFRLVRTTRNSRGVSSRSPSTGGGIIWLSHRDTCDQKCPTKAASDSHGSAEGPRGTARGPCCEHAPGTWWAGSGSRNVLHWRWSELQRNRSLQVSQAFASDRGLPSHVPRFARSPHHKTPKSRGKAAVWCAQSSSAGALTNDGNQPWSRTAGRRETGANP